MRRPPVQPLRGVVDAAETYHRCSISRTGRHSSDGVPTNVFARVQHNTILYWVGSRAKLARARRMSREALREVLQDSERIGQRRGHETAAVLKRRVDSLVIMKTASRRRAIASTPSTRPRPPERVRRFRRRRRGARVRDRRVTQVRPRQAEKHDGLPQRREERLLRRHQGEARRDFRRGRREDPPLHESRRIDRNGRYGLRRQLLRVRRGRLHEDGRGQGY